MVMEMFTIFMQHFGCSQYIYHPSSKIVSMISVKLSKATRSNTINYLLQEEKQTDKIPGIYIYGHGKLKSWKMTASRLFGN